MTGPTPAPAACPPDTEPPREAEIIEELSQHLDERYEELLGGGARDADARRLVVGFGADYWLITHHVPTSLA